VGRLKDDIFIANGKEYSQKKHGFFRRSNEIKIIKITETKLTYSIKHSESTLKIYPYEFEFRTSYQLVENMIVIDHIIENLGNNTLFFSIGEHLAFNCSLKDSNQSYENLRFNLKKKRNRRYMEP
jgi:galactose mutarotase-like enzyme